MDRGELSYPTHPVAGARGPGIGAGKRSHLTRNGSSRRGPQATARLSRTAAAELGGSKGKGWYPLKSFEYLAARRPIVAIGGTGADVVTELLNETKAGRSCPDVRATTEYLRALYQEYEQRGMVGYLGLDRSIGKYSYREMARQFAEVLDWVSGKAEIIC